MSRPMGRLDCRCRWRAASRPLSAVPGRAHPSTPANARGGIAHGVRNPIDDRTRRLQTALERVSRRPDHLARSDYQQ